MLLCTFHVLKAVWKWLNNAKNCIPKESRQEHYRLFRNILYSKTQLELDLSLETFKTECKFSNYAKYINTKIDSDLQSWCLFFRKGQLTRGSDTNNFIEVMFRIFKDIPLERTKAYNLPQLTDFVISDFESNYKQRILDLILNRMNSASIKRFNPSHADVNLKQVQQLNDLQFTVKSNSRCEEYIVDMNVGMCSCYVGENGKICKHQSFIITHYGFETVCNYLTHENK